MERLSQPDKCFAFACESSFPPLRSMRFATTFRIVYGRVLPENLAVGAHAPTSFAIGLFT